MEKSFEIEEIDSGYVVEVNGLKNHFDTLALLMSHVFGTCGDLFKEKTKIKVTLIIDEIDA